MAAMNKGSEYDFKDTDSKEDYKPPSIFSHFVDGADKPVRIPTLPTFPESQQSDGTNYSFGKVQMEAVLESYDLVEFVSPGVSRPNPTEDARGTLLWDKLNDLVRSFIFLNCQRTVLQHIKQFVSAHAI